MLKPNLREKVRSAILSLRQKPDLLVFSLLVILLPSQLGLHFWPDWSLVSGIRVDYLSPTIFFTDILSLFLILNLKSKNLKPKLKTKIFLALLSVYVLINILSAINPLIALYKWVKFLEFGLLAFWTYTNKAIVKSLLPRLLIIPLFYSLILGIAQIVSSGTIGGLAYLLGERTFRITTPGIALVNVLGRNFLRPYASFPHPNVLGGFGLVALLLGSSLGLSLVFLSFSQAAWISAALVLLTKKIFTHISKQIFLCLLLVSILLMPLGNVVSTSRLRLPEYLDKRLMLSGIAGEDFARSPVFGVGLGNFIVFIPESISQKNLWFLQPVHNMFQLVLSETGAAGLLLFSLLMLKVIKKSPAGFAILLTGMVDHYWLSLQQPMLLFALVIGIIF